MGKIRVLYVCHGNICRSSAAASITAFELYKRGLSEFFEIDSAAVSMEEIGNPIYPPMRRELSSRGIPIVEHYARRITLSDIEKFDYIFYMDESNRRYLDRLFGPSPKFKPVFAYTSSIKEIEDPWYSGRYRKVVDELEVCLASFLDYLETSGQI